MKNPKFLFSKAPSPFHDSTFPYSAPLFIMIELPNMRFDLHLYSHCLDSASHWYIRAMRTGLFFSFALHRNWLWRSIKPRTTFSWEGTINTFISVLLVRSLSVAVQNKISSCFVTLLFPNLITMKVREHPVIIRLQQHHWTRWWTFQHIPRIT